MSVPADDPFAIDADVEKSVTGDDLELPTEARERNRLTILSCGIHKERTVKCFEVHRLARSTKIQAERSQYQYHG